MKRSNYSPELNGNYGGLVKASRPALMMDTMVMTEVFGELSREY